ncbi:MAG: hypothetical protein ACYTF0_07005 [Planctomycetota bacterium]
MSTNAGPNGASADEQAVIGGSLWRFITDPESTHLYKAVMASVRHDGQAIAFPLRSDSLTHRRYMRIAIMPLSAGFLRFRVDLEREEAQTTRFPASAQQRHDQSLLMMCAWCKRIELPDRQWAEVTTAVRSGVFADGPMPETSHGICPRCRDAVLADMADGRPRPAMSDDESQP